MGTRHRDRRVLRGVLRSPVPPARRYSAGVSNGVADDDDGMAATSGSHRLVSTRAEVTWTPPYAWWVLLAMVLAAGLVTNWFIAAGLLVFLLANAARPLDFLPAFLVVMAGSAFVHYEGGNLAHELVLLTAGIVLMLICYVVTSGPRLLSIPWSGLTKAVTVFLLWSFGNFARGLMVGHPPKSAITELLGVLALGSTLMVANLFDPKRHMMLAFGGLLLTAFGSAAIGFYVFSILHVRTAGIYFTSFPGIMGLFLLNLALRSKKITTAMAWMGLSLPLFLHQFVSYRRALWMGCLISSVVTILLYTGVGRGSGPRWRRAGTIFLTVIGLGVVDATTMAILYGQEDILTQAA